MEFFYIIIRFDLYINWICSTDNRIQFYVSVSLNYPVKTQKQKQVLSNFKKFIIKEWDLIDASGSTRLKG